MALCSRHVVLDVSYAIPITPQQRTSRSSYLQSYGFLFVTYHVGQHTYRAPYEFIPLFKSEC